MKEFLLYEGFSVEDVYGDGACFHRAIAVLQGKLESGYKSVKADIISKIDAVFTNDLYNDYWDKNPENIADEDCEGFPELWYIKNVKQKCVVELDQALVPGLGDRIGPIGEDGKVSSGRREKIMRELKKPRAVMNTYASYIEAYAFCILVAKANIWILRSMSDQDFNITSYEWHILMSHPQKHEEFSKADTKYLVLYTEGTRNWASSHYRPIKKIENSMPKCHRTYVLEEGPEKYRLITQDTCELSEQSEDV